MSILAGYMVPHPPMILPEIGRGEEKTIQKTIDSYRAVAAEIAELEPETIIVTTPHSVMYSDYFHISPGKGAYGDMSRFGARGVSVNVAYDRDLIREICDLAEKSGLRAGTLGERNKELDHAVLIPLRFVEKAYRDRGKRPDFKVIRIGLSGQSLLDHYALGILIQQAVSALARKTVFIASGDLSHYLKEDGPYGFHREGPVYDARIMKTMETGNFGELLEYEPALLSGAGECGHRSITIMAGAFDMTGVETRVYSYESVTGVDRRLAERKDQEDEYVRLARLSLETFVREQRITGLPDGLPEEMTQRRAGAFVSLHIDGNLRGCIGTVGPTRENVAEEIIHNAVSAASRDPRFSPVAEAELPFLEYSVDVLGETEKIRSPEELDVKRYGVIVTCGGRQGLLLPNLDGVRDVEQQISTARQKAGIRPDEEIELERFEVVRHY